MGVCGRRLRLKVVDGFSAFDLLSLCGTLAFWLFLSVYYSSDKLGAEQIVRTEQKARCFVGNLMAMY
jgi:hypothetical protein